MDIDDSKGTLELVWNDVYDLDTYATSPMQRNGRAFLTFTAKLENGKPLKAVNTMPRTPSWLEMLSSRKL